MILRIKPQIFKNVTRLHARKCSAVARLPLHPEVLSPVLRRMLPSSWPTVVRCLIAVSGGPDSMALLNLLHGCFAGNHAVIAKDGQPLQADEGHGDTLETSFQLVGAVTVDHALRKESRAEAEGVGAYCSQALGLPHFIYTVKWPPEAICPQTGKPALSSMQAEARSRRYAMLAQACLEHRASHVFLAHTADDQAETLLLRWGRASGLHGLAGMAPVTQRVVHLPAGANEAPTMENGGAKSECSLPMWLCRPLLGFSKAQLIATCRARGVPYVTDPSNANTVFDRVRVRQALQQIASAAAEQAAPRSSSSSGSLPGVISAEDARLLSAASLQGVCERARRTAAELDHRGEIATRRAPLQKRVHACLRRRCITATLCMYLLIRCRCGVDRTAGVKCTVPCPSFMPSCPRR